MNVSTPVFADGLGRRVLRMAAADAPVTEHLLLDGVLADDAGFMAALRDRAAQLQSRRLTSYARVLKVDAGGANGPEVVSEYVRGWRLADLLDVAESENLTLDIGVVMLLLRQLLPTAALLSTQDREAANGALGPEHLLLTPQGRLVMTDYVFGSAIDSLHWTPETLWRSLRVATPPVGGGRAVSQRGDVVQVGVTILSLMVGRRLRDDEFPGRLADLVSSARQKTPAVIDAPLSTGLRDWLMRALQLAPKSFDKLFDAQMALERLLSSEAALLAQPAELDQAVARFERFMPVVELPQPPEELLLEAPPPDLVPLAVAFDRPATPRPAPQVPSAAAAPANEAVMEAAADPPPAPTRRSGTRRKGAAKPVESAPVVEAVGSEPDRDDVAAADSPSLPVAVASVAVAPNQVEPPARVETRPTPVPSPNPEPVPVPMRSWSRTEAEPEPTSVDAAPVIVEVEAPWWRSSRAVAALFALAVIQMAVIGWQATRPTESLGGDGELVVQSRPPGAQVSIDDQPRGVTPLTVRVASGTHVLQVRAGSAEPRVIPLSIRAGTQTAQYVEMQGVATTGVLEVRSEPAKARVTIDGRERGSTPLTLRDVAPGDYQVVVERAGWKSTQTVRVEPGATAQLVVPIPRAPAPAAPPEANPPPTAEPPSAEPPKSQ